MYACDVCSKEFQSKQQLGGHIGSHNRGAKYLARRSGSNWNECSICGKKTKNPKFCSLSCLRKKPRQQLVKVANGAVTLSITREELDEYRLTHLVCEICGQTERRTQEGYNLGRPFNLCVDHDHDTLTFRGLLCSDCNRKLGWYEKYRAQVEVYLDKAL